MTADDPGALIFPTERNCLDDKPANAAISQVFKHLIHLGGDTETARLAFTLVLPLLQPSPRVPKANQCPDGKCPAWGQCWSTFWGHLHPQGMAPGLPATLGNTTAHAGMGDSPFPSCRDHATSAGETLDARPNTLASGSGICPDNGTTAAPTQEQADE